MSNQSTIGKAVSADGQGWPSLYRRAFAEFGGRALWNMREIEAPSYDDALAVARQLRVEGNLKARKLAELIERSARAAL